MNKKIIVTSLALMLGIVSFSSTNAFFGGEGHNKGKRGGIHKEMTQEKFDEMKALFNKYTNVADFIAAKEAAKEEKKAEKEAMKESVTKNVEKISNGVIVTITSTDSTVVEKIQNKEARDPKNEEITRIVENISNGVKMTITSDNEELVEKIQNHSERDGKRRGKMNKIKKRMNKNGGEGRFAKFRQRLAERFSSSE